MKIRLLLLLFFCHELTLAQNGFSITSMPTGYTTVQLRSKNAIAIDNANNKWVGFLSIGLGKLNGSGWTMYDISNSQLPSNDVRGIAFDAIGNAWIGTNGGGLAKFDGTNWTIFNTGNSGIASDVVYSVSVNGSDIWLGTNAGVSKYNGSTFTNYTVSNSSLPSDTVQCFAFEPNGDVWIGSANGLCRLAGSNWTIFNASNSGLLDDNVLSLLPDGLNLWIGTRSGGVHKHYNGAIASLSTLKPTNALTYPTTIHSLARGPQGGIVFSGGSMWGGLLYEILNDEVKTYYSTLVSTGGTFIASESASGLLWLVNRLGTFSPLYHLFSFDNTNYIGLGLGLTPENTQNLDINQVNATLLNRGDMHSNLNNAGYEVPKGSGVNAVLASAMWIGGLDNGGNLHTAAMTYRQTGMDFWPGPLDTVNYSTDTANANQYDKIWKIDRFKIQEFIYYFNNGSVQNGTYTVDPDILSWPAHGTGNYSRKLAPFVDVNGNGVYDPLTGGDYPDILGDQMLYWIFNDSIEHSETGGSAFGFEIHASAYAFTCPNIADSLKVLNYTTFYNYKIINRSNMTYDSLHIGLWQDCGTGNYSDDYVGCLPQYNFGMAYNGDGNDEGPAGYGVSPPVSSQVILDGPLSYPNDAVDNNNNGTVDEPGEKNLMTSFVYYNNDFTQQMGNPVNDSMFYFYCKGLYGDGTPRMDCNNTVTTFDFAGFPSDPNSCAETNAGNFPADKRFVTGCGAFQLAGGDTADISYAVVFSRDTNLTWNTLPYYQLAVDDVRRVRNWYLQGNFPSCLQWNLGEEEIGIENPLSVYPNPAASYLIIDYRQKDARTRYEVYDMNGKLVAEGPLVNFGKNAIALEELNAGLYLLRIIDGGETYCSRFIKH